MSNQIFRKKNIDRLNSPEELQDYVRVATPTVWLLMASIILLLIGACVWGTFGLISRTLHLTAYVNQGTAYIFIPKEDASAIQEGDTFIVDETSCTVRSVSGSTAPVSFYMKQIYGEEYDWENLVEDPDERVIEISAATDLQDGIYAASVTVEKVHPISFLLN